MRREAHQFAIRRVVIEYGSIPIASWLQHIDSTAALSQALEQLRAAGEVDGNRCFVDIPTLARCLDVPEQHSKILADTLDAVTEAHHLLVRRPPGRSEADAVDVHAIALFLFAQLYIRQAQRPEAMEVWPFSSAPASSEAAILTAAASSSGILPDPLTPQSPARSNSSTSSQGSGRHHHSVQFQQQKSNHLVRRELQAHLQQHAMLLHGYTDHMRRHTHALLSLVLNRPLVGIQEGSYHGHSGNIMAGEFDRLSFLLRSAFEQASIDTEGSPMDVSPTPFTDDGWRLSLSVPLFKDASDSCEAPFSAVAEWLAANIYDEVYPSESMVGSPRKGDPYNSLPLAGVVQGGIVDIQGVCKSTVVRGEDDFPSGTLRVTDCHDTIIYALAPLQYASVICCSDCTVVVGAVARMLRVERCERLTLIAASVRLCISTCHECTFYLGVNRPPLLVGDNRVLQMAPYNTQYERLPVHLAAAGVEAEVNLWDQPVTLAMQHRHATPDSGGAAPPGSTSQSRPPVQLLPPEKLLPFMVPFQGGRGQLCGGAASGGITRLAADLGSFVGLGDMSVGGPGLASPSPQGPLPSSPFRLPPAYQEAKERKVQAVTELRQHIKSAVLDEGRKRELQSVIQAYFKEWLTSTGTMRQVYDLARMEREEGGLPMSPRGP